jgi:hypothetical protein
MMSIAVLYDVYCCFIYMMSIAVLDDVYSCFT